MFFKQKEKIKSNNLKRKGFTLIEMLVVLFMFSTITVTFYRVFSAGTVLMIDAKKRIAAAHVANEKLEIIRSLDYGDIGVISGNPSGVIDPDEYVTSGVYQFHVLTSIIYKDDPLDGIGAADGDDANDYKRARVDVKWGSEGSDQTITSYSDFVPFGVEEEIAGSGTLSIRVIDGEGAGLAGANVNILNNSISSPINMNVTTEANGYIIIPGAEASDQTYILTASKSGYDTISTLPPYPTSSYYPTDVHASVVDSDISEAVISIGEHSNLQIQFWDAYGGNLPNINFDMEGGRNMGTETDGTIIYNYNESLVSDGGGIKTINDLSPGSYKITITEPGYKLWCVDSSTGNEPDELILPHGKVLHEKAIKILNEASPSYFVQVLDADTGIPLHDASVTVTNSTEGFDETVNTDEYGYAFFPDSASNTMMNGTTYDVSVTISGYTDETTSTTISNLTEDTISLNP